MMQHGHIEAHGGASHKARDFVIRKLDKKCYERQEGVHPARSPLHCFFYLKEGTVLVEVGQKTYFVQADDLVVIPAGQMFKVRYYEKSQGFMGGFHTHCIMEGDTQESAMARFPFLRVWGSPKIILGSVASERINALFERLCEENSMPVPNKEIIRVYMTAVLLEADALYNKNAALNNTIGEQMCNRFLDMLFNTAETNVKQPVSEYAARLNITPNHLNKVVKRLTGKSPSEWIEESIMVKAKMLLRNTSTPLNEIASELGIHDQSYFARRFKRHEGLTPSQYRSNLSSRQSDQ